MVKYVIILAVLSGFTHFLFFGQPPEIVFDEVHFGKFISGYFTGEYFFDIHPPLGKLLIAGMGYLGGFKPGFGFANIGEEFPDNLYLWLRFLPALAGALLPIIIFFLAKELNFSKLAAFAAGLFLILENSLLTQSLFILLDSMLLIFGFSGLLLYFVSKRKNSLFLKIISAALLAFAFSVKWTGASFLAMVIIIEAADILKNKLRLKEIGKSAAIFILIPLAAYFSVFAVHFSLLNKSGTGDAFMTPQFQKTLLGSQFANDETIELKNTVKKFSELNLQMYLSNQTLTATHPYSSQWYSWPFMARSIYYWNKTVSTEQSKIYLMGNPLIYWGSALAVVLAFSLLVKKWSSRTLKILTGGYLLNLLPFIFIGRVMFLYHYFTALVFAVLLLAFILDRISGNKAKKTTFAALIIVFSLSFAFFSPLTYGLPLSDKDFSNRIWLNGWQ